MSSESSTEQQAPSFRAYHFFVVAALLAATAGVLLARDTSPENLVLMSVAVATAAGVGVAGYRMLAPLLAPDVMDDGGEPHQRQRDVLNREKALVLRSIKDLEFDRAMGKVSEADFDEMVGRLRQRAIGLMKELDEWGHATYREIIARELERRLGGPVEGEGKPQNAPGHVATPEVHVSDTGVRCASCGEAVSADDAFCRHCGHRLAAGA